MYTSCHERQERYIILTDVARLEILRNIAHSVVDHRSELGPGDVTPIRLQLHPVVPIQLSMNHRDSRALGNSPKNGDTGSNPK